MGEVVFIDKGEMDKAPSAVREAFSKESGSIPHVALSNASGTKVYGTSNHKALVGGLSMAMRDAKRAMKADVSGATDSKPAETSTKSPSAGDSASDTAPPPGDIKITESKGVKDISGAPLEEWVNSRGTKVIARLTRTTATKVTLQTDKGKTIILNQSELAPDSYKRVQEITSQ